MSRKKGNEAEEKAVLFLQERGFEIIERNFYSYFGEIDIIAKKESVIHFIEVKSSSKNRLDPIYNITPSKLSKIIKTVSYFLVKTKTNMPYCIDAITVKGNSIQMYENITV